MSKMSMGICNRQFWPVLRVGKDPSLWLKPDFAGMFGSFILWDQGSNWMSRMQLKSFLFMLENDLNKSFSEASGSGVSSTWTITGLVFRKVSPTGHFKPRWWRCICRTRVKVIWSEKMWIAAAEWRFYAWTFCWTKWPKFISRYSS